MARDPRYDILFEPVRIGPVTAKNRFFQVPHCTGMGHRYPRSVAAHRGIKAEGGWSVVCTEEVEVHHSSDISPANEGRLWDDRDIPAMEMMVHAVHEHGALAAVELAHNGLHNPNHFSREIPLAPMDRPVDSIHPLQARAVDKKDIRDVRRWHRAAALRAKKAGFDLVYVYAGHDMSLAMHFLSRRHNQRTDEYGGSVENRVRFFRELIEDTKDAVGDTCGVIVRLAVDELMGQAGISCQSEGRDIVAILAELPDLWDVNISGWANDSNTSRFSEEGYQEEYTSFVKQLTTKPVVGVGRFTSPDTMVSQIRRGILDMIGAARPSIADPFLPKKIEEGRLEDLRECIGCNICVTGDNIGVPMRCTQNPTVGEEWRRGWHPENIPGRASEQPILIVGGGPAGLEAARALGQRGYELTLAEAETDFGGRVRKESKLPGLSTWLRVRDYRLQQIAPMPNVAQYRQSRLSAQDIFGLDIPRVVLATGSYWRRDCVGRRHHSAVPGLSELPVHTPDDITNGVEPAGHVVVYDDDHYYMGGVIAEKLRGHGNRVTLVTPAPEVSSWTRFSLEQERIQGHLLKLGVEIRTSRYLVRIFPGGMELACTYTDRVEYIESDALVPVTARIPDDGLYLELTGDETRLANAGITLIQRIGDCLAPSTIATAVYAGHQCAREFDQIVDNDIAPFKREDTPLMPKIQ